MDDECGGVRQSHGAPEDGGRNRRVRWGEPHHEMQSDVAGHDSLAPHAEPAFQVGMCPFGGRLSVFRNSRVSGEVHGSPRAGRSRSARIFAIKGKSPSRAKDNITDGENTSDGLRMRASWVPALMYTRALGSMPSWLTQ